MATSSLQAAESDKEAELRLAQARRKLWLDRITSIGALLVIVVVATIAIPSFSKPVNVVNVLRQSCVNGLMAAGQTFVILSGGIDLSVGSYLAVIGVTSVVLMAPDAGYQWNPWVASLVGLVLATFAGLFTGFWVIGWNNPRLERAIQNMRVPQWLRNSLETITQKAPIPPFIVTLSMMLVLRGLAIAISQSQPKLAPAEFGWLGQESVMGVPVQVFLTAAVYIVCFLILSRTKFGRSVYAIGGNEQVARLSGIKINRVKLGVYALSGLFAGMAAIVLASRMGSGQVAVGNGDELNSIAAVVIGGTSMAGGEGGIMGTLIGTLIIAVILNILNLLAIPAYGQYLARGAVIMLAVYIDSSIRRKGRGQ